jgi:hypothetical protein
MFVLQSKQQGSFTRYWKNVQNFTKTWRPSQNSSRQNSDIKQVSYTRPTNIRNHSIKFSRLGDLADPQPCDVSCNYSHALSSCPHTSGKGKATPLQAWTGPWGSRRLRLPEFLDSRHVKVVRLSALGAGRLYPQGKIPGTNFCQRLSRPQGHSAAGRIESTNNLKDPIRNQTRDHPACSAVRQLSALPRASSQSAGQYFWRHTPPHVQFSHKKQPMQDMFLTV